MPKAKYTFEITIIISYYYYIIKIYSNKKFQAEQKKHSKGIKKGAETAPHNGFIKKRIIKRWKRETTGKSNFSAFTLDSCHVQCHLAKRVLA